MSLAVVERASPRVVNRSDSVASVFFVCNKRRSVSVLLNIVPEPDVYHKNGTAMVKLFS